MKLIVGTGEGLYRKEGYSHYNFYKWHPTVHLNKLLEIINKGKNVVLNINEDTTLQHINNLTHLHDNENRSEEIGYKGLSLNPSSVSMFEFVNGQWVELEYETYGFQIEWVDKCIQELVDKTYHCQELVQ